MSGAHDSKGQDQSASSLSAYTASDAERLRALAQTYHPARCEECGGELERDGIHKLSACDAIRYGEVYVRRLRDDRDDARSEVAYLRERLEAVAGLAEQWSVRDGLSTRQDVAAIARQALLLSGGQAS